MSAPRGVRGKAAVVGIGYSEIATHASRPLGLLALDAIRSAVADAGLSMDDVDGLATHAYTPSFGSPRLDGVDIVSVHFAVRQLGLERQIDWFTQPEALVQNAFVEAVNAVAAGACEACVVFRAMPNPVGPYNLYTAPSASGLEQFSVPYGLFRGYQLWGSAYHEYMHRYSATRREMATLVVNNRANARSNPRAVFRDKPLSVEDYLGARMIADPICLYDCDMPVDAAAAVVIVPADRARDLVERPAYVAGYSQYLANGGPIRSSRMRYGPPLEDIMESARLVTDRLWRQTGLRPEDIDVAQLYDGYSFFMYWWLEALGVCGAGEAHEFVQDGRIALDGQLPVNTFGGQLNEARLHSMGHIAQAAAQVAGRGTNQVAGVDVAVACCGPLVDDSVAIAFTSQPL